MKNIHILPTDQPSRLHKIGNQFGLTENPSNNSLNREHHIYITSSEEIKEGDWYLDTTVNVIFKNDKLFLNGIGYKKIILTTDQDLINDGVQSIDDNFLQWFVKNSSCEFVEIESWETKGEWNLDYKIIIPQEEPKQEILPEFTLSKGVFDKLCDISSKEIPQEFSKLVDENFDELIREKPKQVKYTEDEVRELLIKGLTHNDDKLCGSLVTKDNEIRTANFNIWFEEYKKK